MLAIYSIRSDLSGYFALYAVQRRFSLYERIWSHSSEQKAWLLVFKPARETAQLSASEQIPARKAPKPASTLGAAKRSYQQQYGQSFENILAARSSYVCAIASGAIRAAHTYPQRPVIQSSFLKIASAAKERRVISFKSSGRYGSSLGVLAICWATALRRSKRASIVGNSFGKQRKTCCGRSAALCCIFLSSSRMTFSSKISSSSALRVWFFWTSQRWSNSAIRLLTALKLTGSIILRTPFVHSNWTGATAPERPISRSHVTRRTGGIQKIKRPVHWPMSNGGASTHFQNFLYFSNAGRYEVRDA